VYFHNSSPFVEKKHWSLKHFMEKDSEITLSQEKLLINFMI